MYKNHSGFIWYTTCFHIQVIFYFYESIDYRQSISWLLLSLVSSAMMLLAVETQGLLHFDPCIDSKDDFCSDYHTQQTTKSNTPGFKPFTISLNSLRLTIRAFVDLLSNLLFYSITGHNIPASLYWPRQEREGRKRAMGPSVKNNRCSCILLFSWLLDFIILCKFNAVVKFHTWKKTCVSLCVHE